MNLLDKIAKKYKTDKSSDMHNYTRVYDKIIGPIRNDVKVFLEIGVASGRSLKTWRDYLPNSRIIGVDINPNCQKYKGDRIDIITGNQAKESTFNSIPNDVDIILDDGSHYPSHQITTFGFLYPKLKDGGLYIIEDLHGQFLDNLKDGHDIFKFLFDRVYDVNFNGKSKDQYFLGDKVNQYNHMDGMYDLSYYEKTIHSISFYRSVCVIEKQVDIE